MSKFIKAEPGLNHSIIYTDNTGKRFLFSGGTWAWRNHNPGNLRPGESSRRHHQIGEVKANKGKFAIFPDDKSGHDALIDLLTTTTYYDKSIDSTISKYAPKNENNTKKYIQFVHNQMNMKENKKIKDLTPVEFEKLWKAIEKIEDYKVGKITKLYEIREVHQKNGSIFEYYIPPIGWVSKAQCIKLAKAHHLDVIVCSSPSGNYIRSRPGKSPIKR